MENDKVLYEKFLNGNKDVFNEVILKYKNELLYFILKYVKNMDVAEDIFQNVFLYIIENKEYYNFKYSFKTYLFMIAKSKSLDYLKSKKYTLELDETIDDGNLLEEIILTKERQEKIKNVINKMNFEYQLVIYLTQIEGLSYKETGMIMEKSESQIKKLSYLARKKLKELLVKEKVVEIKNNKIIKLLTVILLSLFIISSITVYAINVIKTKMIPVYSGKIGENDMNIVWTGSFQLAWNELCDYFGGDIEFENSDNNLNKELNKNLFTKEMLDENNYYIKVAETTPGLKKEIKNDLKKFKNIESFGVDKINTDIPNSITIYAAMEKEFTFINEFDVLGEGGFNKSEENVKYFGIDNYSDSKLYEGVNVLFYEENRESFAVKLKTLENEEVILYKTNEKGSFEEIYDSLKKKQNKYEGNKNFLFADQLSIPYIDVALLINYEELCNKYIKGTDGVRLNNAMQNIKFSMNEKGGGLSSFSIILPAELSVQRESRRFCFTEEFIVFLKEEGKEKPYFALRVKDTDVLSK